MIYFDSAATSLQKPEAVGRAVFWAMRRFASPGRGSHQPAWAAAETVFRCREAAAELFSLSKAENVVFTCNATHALNIAIKTLVRPGATVLVSGYEHNAVTRPLSAIGGVTIRVADAPLFEPERMAARFAEELDGVSVVVCTHVSNVFGYRLPVEEIAALCRERGIPFVLDASQSAGVFPVDMTALGAAFIAMPGHKGLYGPQGTGILLCGRDAEPLIEGGTGSLSERLEMPSFLPDRLEAGTHNVAGIAGLLEGIRFVQQQGEARIQAHEQQLVRLFVDRVSRLPRVRLYASERPEWQGGVVSLSVDGMDCEEAARLLGEAGCCVRAGLHCAPLAHKTAGTLEGGTLRVSFSAFNTTQEIDRFSAVMSRLVGGRVAAG